MSPVRRPRRMRRRRRPRGVRGGVFLLRLPDVHPPPALDGGGGRPPPRRRPDPPAQVDGGGPRPLPPRRPRRPRGPHRQFRRERGREPLHGRARAAETEPARAPVAVPPAGGRVDVLPAGVAHARLEDPAVSVAHRRRPGARRPGRDHRAGPPARVLRTAPPLAGAVDHLRARLRRSGPVRVDTAVHTCYRGGVREPPPPADATADAGGGELRRVVRDCPFARRLPGPGRVAGGGRGGPVQLGLRAGPHAGHAHGRAVGELPPRVLLPAAVHAEERGGDHVRRALLLHQHGRAEADRVGVY
mmetsp:Transcript_23639/g.36646  ORF Transcript_23639/g.36646 Transcript_23639/m.36646 type:complete len:301 (-) Transcript_23639:143-1045(-)